MSLPIYQNFSEKANFLESHQIVDSTSQLDKCIKDLKLEDERLKSLSNGNGLIYRGVKEAKYKMYSSAQRRYLNDSDAILKLLSPDTFSMFVCKAVKRVRDDKRYKAWIKAENIRDNDFLILAILQHYKLISPMLDFCEDLYTGLFFACDDAANPTDKNGINNYISLYYVNSNIDWIRCSIQEIYKNAGDNINVLLTEHTRKGNAMPEYSQVIYEIDKLPYDIVTKDDAIKFISVTGPEAGITNVNIPITGFSTNYNITNERIQAQHGRFILNTTDDVPLLELMYEVTVKNLIHCIDIHKSLVPYIKDHYLKELNISKNTVYPSTPDSKKLEEIIDSLFPEHP